MLSLETFYLCHKKFENVNINILYIFQLLIKVDKNIINFLWQYFKNIKFSIILSFMNFEQLFEKIGMLSGDE